MAYEWGMVPSDVPARGGIMMKAVGKKPFPASLLMLPVPGVCRLVRSSCWFWAKSRTTALPPFDYGDDTPWMLATAEPVEPEEPVYMYI